MAAGMAATATASASPPPDRGRITGAVSSTAEARDLPCPSTGATAGEWVGVACFPKRAGGWHVDQPDGCTVRSDLTTGFRMMGDCVLTIDEGPHVKVWAPAGAVSEEFRLVWHADAG